VLQVLLEVCVRRGCWFDLCPFACALAGCPFFLGAELEHLNRVNACAKMHVYVVD
jgi:hypothetical protein